MDTDQEPAGQPPPATPTAPIRPDGWPDWLERDDFQPFISHGTGTAAIDWEAAITALDAGGLLSSAWEKRMLRLAASLADKAHVSLGDAHHRHRRAHNVGLLIKSVRHASGRRQF